MHEILCTLTLTHAFQTLPSPSSFLSVLFLVSALFWFPLLAHALKYGCFHSTSNSS